MAAPDPRLRVAAGLFGLLLSQAAHAEDAAPPPKPWYQLITVNAFASLSYTWNFNNPSSNQNQLRAFDLDHNSFRLDAAELVVQKAVAANGDFGFRLDVAIGAVAKVGAARGLFRDITSGTASDLDQQQVFVSYVIPVGHGLRVDFGKFVTPVGAEFIEGYDGYNDNFSRSLLFTYAIPFTHTGFRFTYPFTDKVTVIAMVINGWDNVVDNNAAKSFGVQLAYTPISPLSLYVTYIGGPERDKNDTDFRHLIDAGMVWKPTWRFALTFNADWGYDTNAIDDSPMLPAGAQWTGIALYLRVALHRRFALIARGEIFWDLDGYRTGVAQRVMEATLTPELRITDALVLRADARIDQSDHPVFDKSDGKRHYQPTVGLNAIYVF